MKILWTMWQRLSKQVAGSAATAEKEAKGEAGFTLIELVVVLAIIGALTAMIVPRVLAAMNQAYVSTATNTARELQTAISVAESGNNGSLPNDWGVGNPPTWPGWQTIAYATLYGDVGQTIALPSDETQADFIMGAANMGNGWNGYDFYSTDGVNYLLALTARDKDKTAIVLTNTGSSWYAAGDHFGKAGIYTYDPVTGIYTSIN